MKFRGKLILLILFVALIPLGVSAWTTLSIHQEAHTRSVARNQAAVARSASELVNTVIASKLRGYELAAQTIPWATLSESAEFDGALTLLFEQDRDIAVVALLDENHFSVVASIFQAAGTAGEHPSMTQDLLATFYAGLPFDSLKEKRRAHAPAFIGHEQSSALVRFAIPVVGPAGKNWAIALAWTTAHLCKSVATEDDGLRTSLLDQSGRQLCPLDANQLLADSPPDLLALLDQGQGTQVQFKDAGGVEQQASLARTANGWTALTQQARSQALKPTRAILRQTIFWLVVGLLIAIGSGLYLASGITRPIRDLEEGARRLGEGDLETRIDYQSNDEFGRLAETFNTMGGDLAAREQEIQEWNQELQKRVDDRTSELEKAQNMLLESQKMAAMTSLAAGFAHELNNPLTAVLGLSEGLHQRALRDGNREREVRRLATIVKESKRIRNIVETVRSLSEQMPVKNTPQKLDDILEAAVNSAAVGAKKKGIELKQDISQLLPIAGDRAQLLQLLQILLENSMHATPEGGTISLDARHAGDDIIIVELSDTGCGIPPEMVGRVFEPFFSGKTDWSGEGLGLSVAHQIVEHHQGMIEVQSQVGVGTTIKITLPTFRGGAHLE